jgi:ABC-2 type transport system ATP-binding protein
VSATDLVRGPEAPATAGRSTAGVAALMVRGVTHRFGKVTALDDVSLTVPQGAFSVLLGLNGAGKSTLFALVTRLYDNVTGEIRVCGFDVRRQPSRALAELGVVFQSRALDPDLSLMQNLTYHAALHGIGRREAGRRADELLETVGLADRAKERVRVLSGGQARRVEIARSLLHSPGCLVLDEATVGLDIGSRESIVALVRDLVAREGIGVLWATHLIDEVLPSDHVVVLHKGRVLFEGGVPALLETTGRPGIREAFRAMTGPVQEDVA